MQRKFRDRPAATLQPGYYLLSVRPSQDGKADSLFFEREGGTLKETEVRFKERGIMLLCLRAPTTIGTGEKDGTNPRLYKTWSRTDRLYEDRKQDPAEAENSDAR